MKTQNTHVTSEDACRRRAHGSNMKRHTGIACSLFRSRPEGNCPSNIRATKVKLRSSLHSFATPSPLCAARGAHPRHPLILLGNPRFGHRMVLPFEMRGNLCRTPLLFDQVQSHGETFRGSPRCQINHRRILFRRVPSLFREMLQNAKFLIGRMLIQKRGAGCARKITICATCKHNT